MSKAMAMVSGILLAVAVGLSGCIISKTPIANDFAMCLGEEMTFSVKVFPSNATYTWTLDGEPLSNSSSNFTYTAQAGDHILEVKAKHSLGTDVQLWTIHTSVPPEPGFELLDSLVTIPTGSFMMGSWDNEWGYAQFTTPVHRVTLQSFDIGKYEVTQAQYLAVMGTNPSYFQDVNGYPDTENNPVETVSWYEAREFCTALSAITGRTFTLPSEAQWEYACRAGTTTLYSWGDSDSLIGDYAWWSNNSSSQTHPVGTKLPNPWGLYDMQGNVWEWCLDSWHTNYCGAPTDGSAWEPDIGSHRNNRGGSFYNYHPPAFRSSYRPSCLYPGNRRWQLGFRVVEVR
jgi:formylglycine-generating enzyme required for sulfatase activity